MGSAAARARIAGRWLFAVALLAMASPMHAAEIKVLSSNATKTLLEDIGPMFEKASGHKVTLGFGTSQQVAKRMRGRRSSRSRGHHARSNRAAGQGQQGGGRLATSRSPVR